MENSKRYLYMFWIVIGSILILIPIIDLLIPYDTTLQFFTRLFALYGYVFLSIATMLTPFLKEVMKLFGKPFLKVHHWFAIAGLICITLHPIMLAISLMNPRVFIPDFSSWYRFWLLAGRPALILIYISVVAVLLRKNMKRFWRPIHALMYVVLLFGIVHANLIGTNLIESLFVRIIYILFFVGVVLSFILKRYQQILLNKKKNLVKK